ANADGSVIVGFTSDATGAFQCFRWTKASGTQVLSAPAPDLYCEVFDTNAGGAIVVGRSGSPDALAARDGGRAITWDAARGTRPLDAVLKTQGAALDRWSLARASAVSADGKTVVGWGKDPAGQIEAWIARLD